MAPGLPVVVQHAVKHLLQRPPVEIVLELGRPPLGLHRRIGPLPRLAVELAPFPFEPFAVTVLHPELRLLQMHRLDPRQERPPHAPAQVVAVIGARTDVIHVAAVSVRLSVAVGLFLVLVVVAVVPA